MICLNKRELVAAVIKWCEKRKKEILSQKSYFPEEKERKVSEFDHLIYEVKNIFPNGNSYFPSDVVKIGSIVVIKDQKGEKYFWILPKGGYEFDYNRIKIFLISSDAKVAKELMGRKEGEEKILKIF